MHFDHIARVVTTSAVPDEFRQLFDRHRIQLFEVDHHHETNVIAQRIREHKQTGRGGVTSVWRASGRDYWQPAKLAQAFDDILLIESTSNQVDQFGGYTGMTPKEFIAYVSKLLHDYGLSAERLVLGGDHLGPNAWQHLPKRR